MSKLYWHPWELFSMSSLLSKFGQFLCIHSVTDVCCQQALSLSVHKMSSLLSTVWTVSVCTLSQMFVVTPSLWVWGYARCLLCCQQSGQVYILSQRYLACCQKLLSLNARCFGCLLCCQQQCMSEHSRISLLSTTRTYSLNMMSCLLTVVNSLWVWVHAAFDIFFVDSSLQVWAFACRLLSTIPECSPSQVFSLSSSSLECTFWQMCAVLSTDP